MTNPELNNQLRAVDFFCGAGGMTHGLSLAGIKVVAGVDKELDFKETYELNNFGAKFIRADISQLSFEELQKHTEIAHNDPNLVFVGCSPCQYWSQINTIRDKSESSKLLLQHFQRFVAEFMPGYVIIENVPGIKKNSKASSLDGFLEFLDSNEYVYDARIINTIHHNVPQNRKRYLLIATRLSDTIKLPADQCGKDMVVEKFIGVNNGFAKIEDGHKDASDFNHSTAAFSELNKRRIRMVKHDGGDRLAWKDCPDLQIPTYIGKDNSFKDTYGRMFWKKPAPTITTKFYSISNGRFGHPVENRAISLREGATLQTFPKTYVFKGKQGCVGKQIGNAVPPALAKRIGEAIIRSRNSASLQSKSPSS